MEGVPCSVLVPGGVRALLAVAGVTSCGGASWGKPLGAPDDELAHLLQKLGVVHLLLAHAEDQDAGGGTRSPSVAGTSPSMRSRANLASGEGQCHLVLLSSDRCGGGSVSAKALALLFPQADRWLTRQLGGGVASGGIGRRRRLRLRAAPMRHKCAPASARACLGVTSWYKQRKTAGRKPCPYSGPPTIFCSALTMRSL